MDRLTRAQIEKWRAICLSHWASDETGKWLSHEESARHANALCDLALSALSQEAVRDEALEGLIMPLVDEYADALHAALLPNGGINFAGGLVAAAKKDAIRKALKREPNAAGQIGGRETSKDELAKQPPAPAAPDVAEMVKMTISNRYHAEDSLKHLHRAEAAEARIAVLEEELRSLKNAPA